MTFNDNQKEAINFYKGCCNVIASAGSGKTGVLVNRISNLINTYNVDPKNILAITFSKKAKDIIRLRLDSLLTDRSNSVYVETFHSLGYKIIRMFNDNNFDILSYDWKKQKLLSDLYYKLYHSEISDINEAVNYISVCKNNLKAPSTFDQYGDLYKEYEIEKDKQHLIDYDDMLTKSYHILINDGNALQHCQNQFKFILVDEIQDINKIQYEIIKLIANKYKNLFVVGDIFQNIFEWRGSSNSFVMNFNKDWKDVKTINLNVNYRSSEDIVKFANHFSKKIPEHKFKFYKETIADKPKFKTPEYKVYKNEFDEAENIAKKISQLVSTESYDYKDIAVLSRTNAQLQTFETIMFNNHIPYQVVDNLSFVDKKEVKIIMSYLRLADNINDNDSFEYIYNKPNRWLGKSFLSEVKQYASSHKMSLYCSMFDIERRNWKYKKGINELSSVIQHLQNSEYTNVKKQIQYIRKRLDVDKFVSSDINDDMVDSDKIENLDSLEQLASKYKTIKDFIDYISSFDIGKVSDQNHIQLLTIHKAKGMEFPVVFLIGLNDGILPHRKSNNTNEEMRLAYVAITRAEDELYCSSMKSRNGNRIEESPFVKMMFENKSKKHKNIKHHIDT